MRSESSDGQPPRPFVVVGLVNNMGDAALKQAERQFSALLAAADPGAEFRFVCAALPEIRRGKEAAAYVARHYQPIDSLWQSRLDALVVTGAEPLREHLTAEAYWGSLTALLDQADRHGVPTFLSCLAAHAAVQHFDGIERRRLAGKRSGMFAHLPSPTDPMAAGLPGTILVPHSRWNEVAAEPLEAKGYRILTRSETGTPDLFCLRRNGLFLMSQGHPEYDDDTLLREYQRDVRRFLETPGGRYPDMPIGYFTVDDALLLERFRERAMSKPHRATMADFPSVLAAARAAAGRRENLAPLLRSWLDMRVRSSSPLAA